MNKVVLTKYISYFIITCCCLFFATQSNAQAISYYNSVLVNVGDTAYITTILTDANDQPLVGTPIEYTITGTHPLLPTIINTDANGEATYTYVTTTPGVDNFTMSANNGAINNSGTITINESQTFIAFSGWQTIYPGNPYSSTITLTDSNGNPLPNQTFTYTITGANPSTGTLTTSATGEAILNYTPTNPGTDTITVTSGGSTSSYTVTTVNPNNLFFTFTTGTAEAGNPYSLTTTVTDSNGNPVPNAPITYSVSGSNTATGTAMTDQNGRVILTYDTANAGTDAFTITVGGSSQTIDLIVEAPASQTCSYLKGDCLTTRWTASFPLTPDNVFCRTRLNNGTNDESLTWVSSDQKDWSEVDCGVRDFGLSYTEIIEGVMASQGVNALGGSYTIAVEDTDGDGVGDAVVVEYIGCYLGDLFISSNCYDFPDGYTTECEAGERVLIAPDGTRTALQVDDTQYVTNTAPWIFQFAPVAIGTVEVRTAELNATDQWVDTETGEIIPDVAIDCDLAACPDCATGPITVQACDDNDPCTSNDIETILDCDGSVCVPCQGTLQDCSGTTTVATCDDGNPCTVNDTQEVACDGSICVPCQGITPSCEENILDFANNEINWVDDARSGTYTVGEITYTISIDDSDNILYSDAEEGPATEKSDKGIRIGIDPNDLDDKVTITYNLSETVDFTAFKIRDFDSKNYGPLSSNQRESICVYGYLDSASGVGAPTEVLPIITSYDGSVDINGNCVEATVDSYVSQEEESIWVQFTSCIDRVVIEYGSSPNTPVSNPTYSKIYIADEFGFTTKSCNLSCTFTCDSAPSTTRPCDDGDPFTINDVETILDCDGLVCEPCAGTVVCEEDILDFKNNGINWQDNTSTGNYTIGNQAFDVNIVDDSNILQDTYKSNSGIMVGIDPNDVNDELIISYNLSEVSNNVIFDIVDLDKKNSSSKQQERVCVYGLLGAEQTQILPTITSLDGSVAINGNCAEATTNSAISGNYESVLVEFKECIDKIIIVYGTGSDSPTNDPTYSKIYIGEQYGIKVVTCQDACTPVSCGASGDSDNDGVCDANDACPGFDDNIDLNNNGTPDGCDAALCDTPPVINDPAFLSCINGNVTIRPNVAFNTSCAVTYLWETGEQTPTLTVTSEGTYTFTVTDCNGCTNTSSVTVTAGQVCSPLQGLALITINDDNVSLQNQRVRGSVIGNDINPYSYNLTFNLVSEPSNGRLFFYPSGLYEYIPNADYLGVDEFEYQVCDANLECINATTTITTTSVLFNPLVLNNDDILGGLGINIGLIRENSSGLLKNDAIIWSGNLLVNDATVNGASMIVSTTPVTMPEHGNVILHADGNYEYSPADAYVGKDMFEYEVCTDSAPIVCATAKMYITIIEDMNGMPFGGDDFFSVEENGQIEGDLSLNDYDTDGETLNYSAYTENGVASNIISEQGANVSLNTDGTFTYVPSNGFVGPDFFLYMVTDASGNTSKATVNVLVQRTTAKVDVQVYLAGALGTGINMMTKLNDRGLLPGQTPNSTIATPNPAGQPYHIAPWNYNGTEGANWTNANYEAIEAEYDARVVDWVLVNFRKNAQATSLIGRSAALLLNDGSVVFPESTLPLADLATNALYILVEHRNHVGVMSPAAVNISSLGELSLDLRDKDSYANTGIGQSLLSNGIWAMPAGDGSQTTDFDGYDVNGNDKTIWVEQNGKFDQYSPADYNLDGDVNGGDKVIWFKNNGSFSSVPK